MVNVVLKMIFKVFDAKNLMKIVVMVSAVWAIFALLNVLGLTSS